MSTLNQTPKHILHLPSHPAPPTTTNPSPPTSLPPSEKTHLHPSNAPQTSPSNENATLHFIGTATTLLSWHGISLLTDPNFLHAGDHVHLGPGVTGTRTTNPAVNLEDLPAVDVVLLSHYHADHFDQKVEAGLRRDLPILTTPHAKECLVEKKRGGERFTAVRDLDVWETGLLHLPDQAGSERVEAEKAEMKKAAIKVTAMPGKHVPPGPLAKANDLLGAVPPTNGWMVELGYIQSENDGKKEDEEEGGFECGYRIYISGDTLMVPELKEIPQRYGDLHVDLMLVHLGGTTIPGRSLPLLMVTMDAKQGIQLMKLIHPEVTIPIHYDDYDVFLSPLEDFKKAVEEEGLGSGVVYLARGEEYKFNVR